MKLATLAPGPPIRNLGYAPVLEWGYSLLYIHLISMQIDFHSFESHFITFFANFSFLLPSFFSNISLFEQYFYPSITSSKFLTIVIIYVSLTIHLYLNMPLLIRNLHQTSRVSLEQLIREVQQSPYQHFSDLKFALDKGDRRKSKSVWGNLSVILFGRNKDHKRASLLLNGILIEIISRFR